MSQKKIEQLINKFLKEQLGNMASTGATSDSGNNITSPRPYYSDKKEKEAYMNKNVYGGEGGHYRKEKYTGNYPNRDRRAGMFEEEEEMEEQAYGSATLTTQGQYNSKFTKTGKPPGIMEDDPENIKEQAAGQGVMGGTMGTGGAPVGGGGAATDKFSKELQDIDKKNQKDQAKINKRNLKKFDVQIRQANHQAGIAAQNSTKQLADLDAQIASLNTSEEETRGEYLTLNMAYRELMKKDYFDLTDEDKKNKKEFYKKLVSLKDKIDKIDDDRDRLIQQKNQTKTGTPGAGSQVANLRKQKAQMKRQIAKQAQTIAESLYKDYVKLRKNKSLKEYMNYYKKQSLLEGAMSKFFKFFDEGKTDEEILRLYAEQGVVVPETFVKKARDKFKKLQHEKLDLDELEQETKEFKKISMMEDEPEIEEKKLSSQLQNLKEAEITSRYPIPPEIRVALVDDLKMDPLIRFVKNLKAVNSIPPSYRVFLLNNNYFDIYMEEYSLMVKIGIDEYFLGDLEDIAYAKKHINKLMVGPIPKIQGDEETSPEGEKGEDLLGDLPPLPPAPEDEPPPEEPEE